ncbi:hypothetical protein GGTG_05878 [Gaeumannomyces tritici R3-111a-1]|uniref:Uncharacterized protein n=1 Tax=Gaeumannomyces tritici (strain R3-111a-1) TaxID=644352 RepID=J3NX71_GAET3|nr:hypothetical protein GGTG_05878 [Gaeumannomyces tritici R3-111a-1]EJT75953.1 hypothetical protein GGTG_05878 [Gaeumannomyces tritici R3-111a-1]
MDLVCHLQLARLKTRGDNLITQLRGSENQAILLQHTPSTEPGAAICQAEDDCICSAGTWATPADESRREIKDKYRICVAGDDDWWLYGNSYYHIVCFNAMVDTETLFSEDVCFSLYYRDQSAWKWPAFCPWGLMVRAWFGSRGWVNLDAIDEYIGDVEEHRRRKREASLRWSQWQCAPAPNVLEGRPPPAVFDESGPNLCHYELHSDLRVSLYELIHHIRCSWVDVEV